VNTSDAAVYAEMCGCCPSQVWGVIWLIQAFIFFGAFFHSSPSPFRDFLSLLILYLILI
jgi:hypothetical protein